MSETERTELKKVASKFAFRTNDYYLSLINWDDPNDPIRRIVIPDTGELAQWGRLDPSSESDYIVAPGTQHKYDSTVLLLVCEECDGICRYCFRKRVFIDPLKERLQDIEETLGYIRKHPEVTNVLLTGGDPLSLPTSRLEKIVGQLRAIDHVQIIRIGTKIPVFNPYRIIEDKALPEMIRKYSWPKKNIYIMTHFSHPREMTDIAADALTILQQAGAMMTNQCPLIRGVNDDPEVLAELLRKVSFAGVIPYYVFQCRPALGNKGYAVPIEEAYTIIEQAKSRVSGLAKRVRFVMSHSSGKIEIIGKTDKFVYLKYHRAVRNEDSGRILVFKCNRQACWLDDYDEPVENYPLSGV